MNKRAGFTVVELLIVIVVIAILAAISVTVFNGVQARSKNNARLVELNSWHKLFELYKAANGDYPTLITGGTCLGSGFPIGGGGVARCRDYTTTGANSYLESDNSTLMTALGSHGSLPSGQRTPINGTVGPYVRYYGGFTIDITQAFEGSSSSQCPAPTTYTYTDGNGLLLCQIRVTRLSV